MRKKNGKSAGENDVSAAELFESIEAVGVYDTELQPVLHVLLYKANTLDRRYQMHKGTDVGTKNA